MNNSGDEGAAMRNITLLSRTIAGLKKIQKFESDEFNRWASILSHLTTDEIFIVGKAFIISKRMTPKNSSEIDEFWDSFKLIMENSGYSNEQIRPLCASVSRFGLFLPVTAIDGIIYRPSEWLIELGTVADLLEQ